MFKSTEARAFSDCYEFGEDIGSGQTFRLDVYYRMCRELVDEIKNSDIFKYRDLDKTVVEPSDTVDITVLLMMVS